jgi:two-component sensor histidine kinase
MTELVSNSLKHAFPPEIKPAGEICVELRLIDNQQINLRVSDNGVGFPPDLDFRQTESLGLQLVNILINDELGGSIELDSRNGTKFELRFIRPTAGS